MSLVSADGGLIHTMHAVSRALPDLDIGYSSGAIKETASTAKAQGVRCVRMVTITSFEG